MSCIVVSGLVNVETTLNIGQFPVEYTPIEYKFFGLKSNVAGVKTNEIVNIVGAGDALFSSFIYFYAKGMEVSECLKSAQIFASLKIAYNGASLGFASEEEIEGWYKKIYV
jgi:sugar/nucleoside kinase (ribokinase family)